MPHAYPCEITQDPEGWFLVTFPDVPEAGTDARTREEALALAQDALAAALGGYVKAGQAMPTPSKPGAGHTLVSAPPVRCL